MTVVQFTKSAHQFKPGRHVWVRPARWVNYQGGALEPLHRFGLDQPFTVLERLTINSWPHYRLLAPDGSEWQVSQLEVSSVRLGVNSTNVTLGAPRRVAAA
jgi:hypothetical protein